MPKSVRCLCIQVPKRKEKTTRRRAFFLGFALPYLLWPSCRPVGLFINCNISVCLGLARSLPGLLLFAVTINLGVALGETFHVM